MKTNDKKKAILLTVITMLTVVLGIVAVITATRLRRYAEVPVAPNVPQSQPQAAEIPNFTCSQQFTFQPSVCGQWCNEDTDCATGTVCSASMCRNPACENETDCTCPDAPTPTPSPSPTPLAQCNNSCTTDSECPGSLICSGGMCRHPECTAETDCACPSPTTAPASCNGSCSTDGDCMNGYVCTSGACRNPSCTNATNCSCPTPTSLAGCNQSCAVDADCMNNYICTGGSCRNPSCSNATNCSCPSAPTPTPVTALPQAGNSMQTMLMLSIGAVILIIGGLGWLTL